VMPLAETLMCVLIVCRYAVNVDRNFFCKVTDLVYVGLVDNDGKRWVVKFNNPEDVSCFFAYAAACRVGAESEVC
jgi:hypothetical protein